LLSFPTFNDVAEAVVVARHLIFFDFAEKTMMMSVPGARLERKD
jgi:hypothetical protein